MTKELEIKLVERYPKILAEYTQTEVMSCMRWGMEFSDGWFDLMDKGLHKIQYFCDIAGGGLQLVAHQIKEKYGALRFYYSIVNGSTIQVEILDDLAEQMMSKSEYICEITGQSGLLCSRGGWLKTLCYSEARKLNYAAVNTGQEEYWKSLDDKNKTSEVFEASE
jgi:hypothetical protein